jgi:protein-tyrosine phosphatase
MGDDEAKILIVCTGNICRSPFIERLLKHELDRRRSASASAPAIAVRSAGTGALVGSAMNTQAAAVLSRYGGDATGFTARDLTPDLIAESDLVLTATRSHRGKVSLMSPKALRRVFTFCDFADLVAGMAGPGDPGARNGSRGWVRELTEGAASSRGLRPPLPPASADIVDPYRRGDEVFEAMAAQIADAMPAVVHALAG